MTFSKHKPNHAVHACTHPHTHTHTVFREDARIFVSVLPFTPCSIILAFNPSYLHAPSLTRDFADAIPTPWVTFSSLFPRELLLNAQNSAQATTSTTNTKYSSRSTLGSSQGTECLALPCTCQSFWVTSVWLFNSSPWPTPSPPPDCMFPEGKANLCLARYGFKYTAGTQSMFESFLKFYYKSLSLSREFSHLHLLVGFIMRIPKECGVIGMSFN